MLDAASPEQGVPRFDLLHYFAGASLSLARSIGDARCIEIRLYLLCLSAANSTLGGVTAEVVTTTQEERARMHVSCIYLYQEFLADVDSGIHCLHPNCREGPLLYNARLITPEATASAITKEVDGMIAKLCLKRAQYTQVSGKY